MTLPVVIMSVVCSISRAYILTCSNKVNLWPSPNYPQKHTIKKKRSRFNLLSHLMNNTHSIHKSNHLLATPPHLHLTIIPSRTTIIQISFHQFKKFFQSDIFILIETMECDRAVNWDWRMLETCKQTWDLSWTSKSCHHLPSYQIYPIFLNQRHHFSLFLTGK